MIRHLIAEEVLVEGRFIPARVEIVDGRILAVHELDPGGAKHQQEIIRASEVTAGVGTLRVRDGIRVLPGNVDTHVHINEPGRTSWEGFATATAAAALGGVTTLVDMPLNSIPPTVSTDALAEKKAAAQGQTYVDTGFWGGIVPGNTAELRPLWEAGVFGFKCFLLPSGVDEFPPVSIPQLREAMTEVASFDGLVIVHAEDAATIDAASGAAAAPSIPSYAAWAGTRPHEAEVKAITALIETVRETGCRTHILHLASAQALDIIKDARDEGLPLTVETCPHYLCFEAEKIPDGAAEFKCCPPIRDAGNRDALWQGLQDGLIDCIVSDHSPATSKEKYRGAPDLQQAWGGISGLQVGFNAVAHHARERGIGLEQVSAWMAQNTAQQVNLESKGSIGVGKDADFAFYDPKETHVVSARGLAHKNPVSAYDGLELQGTVVGSVVRGTQLFSSLDTTDPLPLQGTFLTHVPSPEGVLE